MQESTCMQGNGGGACVCVGGGNADLLLEHAVHVPLSVLEAPKRNVDPGIQLGWVVHFPLVVLDAEARYLFGRVDMANEQKMSLECGQRWRKNHGQG